MVWCNVVWFGTNWYDVVWCGAVFCGMLCRGWCIHCGTVWCGVVLRGMLSRGVIYCSMLWYSVTQYYDTFQVLFTREKKTPTENKSLLTNAKNPFFCCTNTFRCDISQATLHRIANVQRTINVYMVHATLVPIVRLISYSALAVFSTWS